jgi:SAM-dependent methyltransferase
MPRRYFYSADDIKKAYEQTADHVHTRNIITQYSVNRNDIRDIALEGLDLSWARHVLELGCGYGAFTKRLAGRLHHDAEIAGIDMVAENGPHFRAVVAALGYRCSFIHGNASLIKQMSADRFDLIIASYSLYFFPRLIKDIARILNHEGVFVVITHSRYSLAEILEFIPKSLAKMGLSRLRKTSLARLFDVISMENGYAQLANHFNRIETIHYQNRLMFSREDIKDCLDYIEKKDALLFKDIEDKYPQQKEAIRSHFYNDLKQYIMEKGFISVTKDDAIFRCFRPLITQRKKSEQGKKSKVISNL